jgi:hypothetical protein
MSDASTVSIDSIAPSSRGVVRLIAPGLLLASAAYLTATTTFLPRIPDASAVIDVFLAAALPGLMVIMLLWAARPGAYGQRRRRTLVAVTLLGAAAGSILPMLLVTT